MNHLKLLQRVSGSILVILLTGCVTPARPVETPLPTIAPTSTRWHPPATRTPVQAASFEQCVALGYYLQNSYPRQCQDYYHDETFVEALEPGIIFSKTNAGKYDSRAGSITATKDGGYLVTERGTYQDIILKLNASGDKEWEYFLGGEPRDKLQLMSAGLFFCLFCTTVRQTSDGDYAVMGAGSADRATPKQFVIKLDRDGKWVSGKTFVEQPGKIAYLDAEGNLLWLNSFGLSKELIETEDGGYMLAGNFRSGVPDKSMHIIKAGANGEFAWEKNLCLDKTVKQAWEEEITCSYNLYFDGIQSGDGGYVLTGGFSKGIWLVKTDPRGNIEWMQFYPGGLSLSLIQTADGGFLVAGVNNGGDGVLIKTDGSGNMLWSRTFGGDQYDEFKALTQGVNGKIAIAGETRPYMGAPSDIWLMEIDVNILK